MKSNRVLKAKIIEHYGTQADFSQEVGDDESLVSRVIRGRRKLSKEQAAVWLKALRCDPAILDEVTQK